MKDRMKGWTYGVKPKCIQHEWCTNGEHYQIPMSMMDGPAGKLGQMNADTILKPGPEQLRKNIYATVIDFMNTLKDIQKATNTTKKDYKTQWRT